MAERAFETPSHFYDYLVSPNLAEFRHNSVSLTAAFNCIMSLDALCSQIYLFKKERGETDASDDTQFRNKLAEENVHFGLIRDISKSLKHGELTRGNPLVRYAHQTAIAEKGYGLGLYGVGKYGAQEVMITLNDQTTKHCLSEVILVTEFLNSKIEK